MSVCGWLAFNYKFYFRM